MLSILFPCTSFVVFAQSKTDIIKVWGNCETCKAKIEKAALAEGATAAEWNDETKLLVVSYDASKTSNLDIRRKIASIGYDTKDARASDAVYKKLKKCCQYKRPVASDSTGMKNENGMNQNMNCMSNETTMDCSANDCCSNNANCCNGGSCCNASAKNDCAKTGFGKGYYYIGSSCKSKAITTAGVAVSGEKINCCKM